MGKKEEEDDVWVMTSWYIFQSTIMK